jgi:hypothetical protein
MKKTILNLVFGLLVALASSAIVLGAISLSLAEGVAVIDSSSPENHSGFPFILFPELVVLDPVQEEEQSVCIIPAGWVPYTIQAGDTLESLAQNYPLSAEDLKTINCLPGEQLFPGALLHLPPDASPNAQPGAAPPPTFSGSLKH